MKPGINMKILVRYFFIFLIFMGGCVPVMEYNYPVDAIIIHEPMEYVYVPRYRPRPLYYWNGMWYDEPHTHIIYQDVRGRVSPRKIPKRIMRDMERKDPVKPITPRRSLHRDRIRIRRIIQQKNRK